MIRIRETTPYGSNWFAEAKALFLKDVRAELRTKVAVSAVGIFAFASLLLLGLATRTLKDVKTLHELDLAVRPLYSLIEIRAKSSPSWENASKMGVLWVLLCFAAFAGLAHTFVHEEETGTVTALRLTMSSGGVYAGKLAFNMMLLFAVALLVTPSYMLLTGMPTGSWIVFLLVMCGGCLGLGSTATIIAALAAKARGTGALFGAIGLPLLTVFLLLLLNAANTLYNREASLLRQVQDIGGLFSFSVLLIAISALTFHFVWED